MKSQSPANYFIKTDKGQFGPITLEMVKTVSINRDSMLWKSGTDSWQKAEDFQELKSFFTNYPPSSGISSLHQHSFIKKKILVYNLTKSLRQAFFASLTLTIAIAIFLWFRFQPNKFGQDNIDKINNYLSAQRTQSDINLDVVNETPEEKKKREDLWKFFLKGEEDPFKDQGIVPSAPAISIPYEYLEGFWDYCSQSNGKVKLDVMNLKASFESRKEYLIARITKVATLVFLLSLFGLTALLLNFTLNKIKK